MKALRISRRFLHNCSRIFHPVPLFQQTKNRFPSTYSYIPLLKLYTTVLMPVKRTRSAVTAEVETSTTVNSTAIAANGEQATEVTIHEERGMTKKVKTTSSKKKAWEPFDPSLPTNTTFPEKFQIPPKSKGTFKIVSYNVAGLNACIRKGFNKYIDAEDADIVCIQEHKVNAPHSTAVNDSVYKYRYWSFDEKKGYAGVAVFSKYKPEKVEYGIPGFEKTTKGRVVSLTFPNFTLINCYSPNAGDKLKNLDIKQRFDKEIERYIRSLQKEQKSVIWTGDLNVAHTPDDLARPETNQRSAGFTKEERDDFTKILSSTSDNLPGLIDTWRHLHPEQKGHYTYYGYRFNCRSKLIGWRLDYFTVTPELMDKVVSSDIRHEGWGASDHVPLVLTLKDIKL
ncbi:Endonuclease/exonuclease/phosphatase [Mycotypha africana]|uniref:Endonuclease/exonuclease/phosphatase n=1 Tax=Mycotypha africana TaxID=64632 RepID=UPI00230169AA|nr:Endonuclease/exonuclease/phosphatase [Mycotypha africana]KAI8992182.1 Endonuclease/exonuclease/phosphatase [Mycotypha africana]